METVRNVLKTITIKTLLFVVGGLMYCFLEILSKANSSTLSFIIGGICFIVITEIDASYDKEDPLLTRMVAGTMVSVFIETIVLLAKVLLVQPTNIMYIFNMSISYIVILCIQCITMWFILSLIAIVFDDYVRYYLFYEDEPEYKFF